MRGIETSMTHRSGFVCERLLEGVDAVLGLGHDLHVGLALDQQPQPAAHDAVVVGDQDPHVTPMVSSMVVPAPGAVKTSQVPADEQRALAHAAQAEAARPAADAAVDAPRRRLVEAAAVVAHAQQRAPDERQLHVDAARARVLGDVGEALLRDAVDHELLLVGQRRQLAVVVEAGLHPGALAEVAHLGGSAAIRPWSSSAVGRSWRASAQQLVHRLR